MSEELQQRTESLRKMVETRDLVIADLEREIRELRDALNGTPAEWDGKRMLQIKL